MVTASTWIHPVILIGINMHLRGITHELFKFGLAITMLASISSFAFGHAKNETYIWLNAQEDHFDGRVELCLVDLRKYLDMDIPTEVEAAREDILARAPELSEYVTRNFELKTKDGEIIPYEIVKIDLAEAPFFGHFAQIFFKTAVMDVPAEVRVKGTFLFEQDKYSRCLLCTTYNHFTGITHPEAFFHAVYSPWNDEQAVDFNKLEKVKMGRKYFIWEGIRHIWIGIDHILFLVTLLLASVLVKRRVGDDENPEATEMLDSAVPIKPRYKWIPVEGFPGAFWNIFKIVTIFTIAHSITLALASLDIITLPSRLVESIIALSIVLVAINNIIPTFRDRTWIILFMFGLFHGMGFASVMQNLPFRMPHLKNLLVCFNVGVELGQMAIVAAVFPVIFLLRKMSWYKPVILIGGSLVMIVVAGYWFVERAMGWA